jgi:hypothetical protein
LNFGTITGANFKRLPEKILLDQNKDEWTLGQINIANYNYLKNQII